MLTPYQEERLYHSKCREAAMALLKKIGAKHIIYGIDKEFTDWETEMRKFFDDASFNEYVDEVYERYGNVCFYAVHARN